MNEWGSKCERRHGGVKVRGPLGNRGRACHRCVRFSFSGGPWQLRGSSDTAQVPLHPSSKHLWRNSWHNSLISESDSLWRLLSVALVRGHPGLSGERWFCEGKVCSVIRGVGVWGLGLVCSTGLVQRSPCLQSFTATLSLPSLVDTYQSPLITFSPYQSGISLKSRIHLLMSVVLTPILYQESCSALGMQRQVSLDPVLLGCLPWSRDLGQKGQKCLRPFKYSGFTSGPFISVKKV